MKNLLILILGIIVICLYLKIEVKVDKNSKEYKSAVDTTQKVVNKMFEKIK
jgi:hypothetical protein